MPTDSQWTAIVERTEPAEPFLYAVRTTGIFCRPACPSRRPRRENVVVFASGDEARRAGFRACLKCTPDESSTPAARMIRTACAMMERAEEPPSLAKIAAAVGLSPSHFHREFRKGTGVTPKEYLDALRRRRLQSALAGYESVSGALYGAGFGSTSRLYERSDRHLGMKPATYKKGGKGMEIRYAVSSCSLGWLAAATTDRGICAIELADSPGEAADAVNARFPHASLTDDDEALAPWLERIVGYVDHPEGDHGLPLDIAGTAFQQRVWKALQEIVPGRTTTYQGLADAIGAPSAVRAVAGACAANPVAIVIPCHRVTRSNGESGGYRWGVERKLALLEREQAAGADREEPELSAQPGLFDTTA